MPPLTKELSRRLCSSALLILNPVTFSASDINTFSWSASVTPSITPTLPPVIIIPGTAAAAFVAIPVATPNTSSISFILLTTPPPFLKACKIGIIVTASNEPALTPVNKAAQSSGTSPTGDPVNLCMKSFCVCDASPTPNVTAGNSAPSAVTVVFPYLSALK